MQGCVLLVGWSGGLWKAAQSIERPASGTVTYRKWPVTLIIFCYSTVMLKALVRSCNFRPSCQRLSNGSIFRIPDAVLVEWSLPGPFKGSDLEMFSWLVFFHFSLESDLRSQSHWSLSKSQRRYSSGVIINKNHGNKIRHSKQNQTAFPVSYCMFRTSKIISKVLFIPLFFLLL